MYKTQLVLRMVTEFEVAKMNMGNEYMMKKNCQSIYSLTCLLLKSLPSDLILVSRKSGQTEQSNTWKACIKRGQYYNFFSKIDTITIME